MELLKLQQEVRELRQQNFERQKDIQYVPFNIISNNLYINNSLNKSSINSNLPQNNNIYNTFIAEREIQKKRQLEQKKRTPFGKLPLRKGMFSYKTSSNIGNNNYNYNNMYRNNSQNIIEVQEPVYNENNINHFKYKNDNNPLLSADLKLNLDDNYIDNDDNNYNEQNRGLGERVLSASSLNLNKYKINKNNIINQKKNILIQNNQAKNYSNRLLNLDANNNQNDNNTSLIMNKSQIIRMNQNDIETRNNLSKGSGFKKKKIRKIADHFKNNPKYEKESRRMIIEYIKILNKRNIKRKKVYLLEDIEKNMEKYKISKKVLNKEYTPEEFNPMSIFNNSINVGNNKNLNNESTNSRKNILNNSFETKNNANVKQINNNTNNNKLISKNLFSPIKKNINNFLSKMNDVKKDKINILAFLSVPRIMNLYFMDEKYTFIFVLCPNNICCKDAIESYIFKFADINKKQYIGGFDLIKVKICSRIQNKPNNFYIETCNGKKYRNYEFETKSSYLANNYVKGINYLTQLVKCKLYNLQKKNVFLMNE